VVLTAICDGCGGCACAALQFAALQKDFSKRWANQSRAVGNLFKGPNQIEDISGMQAT